MNLSDGLSVVATFIACIALFISYRQHKISTNPKLYFHPNLESYREQHQFDETSENNRHWHRGARIQADIRNDSLSLRVSEIRIDTVVSVKRGFRKYNIIELHSKQLDYLDPGQQQNVRNWWDADGESNSYLETALMELSPSILHRHPAVISNIETMNTPFIIDEVNQVELTFTLRYQPAIDGVKEKKITKTIVFTPTTLDLDGEQILDKWHPV